MPRLKKILLYHMFVVSQLLKNHQHFSIFAHFYTSLCHENTVYCNLLYCLITAHLFLKLNDMVYKFLIFTYLIFLIFKTHSYFTETDGIILYVSELFYFIKLFLFQAFCSCLACLHRPVPKN